jgi:hypothetical protein
MWLPLLLVVLFALAWYLSFSASRVDRLHHRVESTRAALDAQLARRAGAALELASHLDPHPDPVLARAASAALDIDPGELSESAQNDLTRAILTQCGDPTRLEVPGRDPAGRRSLDALAGACTRTQLARRFHNDAVAQAQRMRRKRVVRWARLAGHAALPQMVEIDDSIPPALAEPPGALSWKPSAGPPHPE